MHLIWNNSNANKDILTSLKPVYYILLIDLVITIIMIKPIFGNYKIFLKSLADHFYPDDLLPNPLDRFAEENDSKHKINILYALVLFLAGVSFAIYYFIL